jgi:hypothetical protein
MSGPVTWLSALPERPCTVELIKAVYNNGDVQEKQHFWQCFDV